MCFEISRQFEPQSSVRIYVANKGFLNGGTRLGERWSPPILIDTCSPDYSTDDIAISNGIIDRLYDQG